MMAQLRRFVLANLFFVLIFCVPFFFAAPSLAQTGLNLTGSSNCTVSDFDATVEFVNGLDDTFTIVVDKRNLAGHPCIFDGPLYGPSLVPDRVKGYPPVKLCYECDKSATNIQNSTNRPLTLDTGKVARQTFSWKDKPKSASVRCVQLNWIAGPVLLATPSLFKPVCSDINVSGFSQVATPENQAVRREALEGDKVLTLSLSSDKSKYDEGENFAVRIALAQPGSVSPSNQEDCPRFYLRERSPNGATRVDEVRPLAFKGCGPHALGYELGDWASGFELDSGANSRWIGTGEHAMEVFLMMGSLDDPQVQFSSSNILRVQVVDPATIDRKWGPRDRGIAADITLDKDTFRVGENIILHLAIENFDATVPIAGPSPLWDPCDVVGIEVLDATGHELSPDNRFEYVTVCTGHGLGPILYEKGKIVPIERSLRAEGSLPNRPGTYTILVTWAPYEASKSDSGQMKLVTAQKRYAVARAAAKIAIVDIDTPSSK